MQSERQGRGRKGRGNFVRTERIEKMIDFFVSKKEQKQYRNAGEDAAVLPEKFSAEGLDDMQRSVERLRYALQKEIPVVFPDEKIALLRTNITVPAIHTEEEDKELHKTHAFHENGCVFNMCPDYAMLMEEGFEKKAERIKEQKKHAETEEQKEFLDAELSVIDIVTVFAERYRREAEKTGNKTAAESFANIPAHKPETFLQALQFLRLLHYCMWCNGNYHNTLGRIDQYLYPYYKKDRESGLLDQDGAMELMEEFFVSCNRDSDLYIGVQQGDNGQTIVLGGTNPDGSSAYNDLSELCLLASRDCSLIDPKVNLRVSKNTPLSVYVLATTLTKKGLGFPQYSNDDVIIPGLIHWGYEPEDAYNYTLAACWEILIPGTMDLVNWDSLNFLGVVQDATEKLPSFEKYEDFEEQVRKNIFSQAEHLMNETKNVYKEPSPLVSLMCPGCLENMRDISEPGKYNNYGFHGDGLSNAADAMANIKKYVFEEKRFTPEIMLDMLHKNFKGYEKERNILRYDGPKMGSDDDCVDSIAVRLLDDYADALEGKKNDRGGIFRPGTASAMYYIWHSEHAGASADGRDAGEALACNFSPSLFARSPGPVSIIKSFSKPHLSRVVNGGPLTIELHDTMFRDEEAVQKCAMYVKSFMDMGGHQMQINSVNRDRMLDAKKHPENYQNLIVRVWGWSGYFVELDEVYQDHIIKRSEMMI